MVFEMRKSLCQQTLFLDLILKILLEIKNKLKLIKYKDYIE